jgi:hypothetical protein
MRIVRVGSVLGLVAALALAAVASLGSGRQVEAQTPGIEAGIRATMQSAVDAWNRGDVGAFVANFTDDGLQAEFDLSLAEAGQLGDFIGDPPITLRSISEVKTTGDPATATEATAVVELNLGNTIDRAMRTFVLESGRWKIDDVTELPVAIPSGTTSVDMRLVEYAFVYDKAAASRGNIAFRVQNAGAEPHEIVLIRLETDTPLLELVQSEDEPEGIEFISQGGPWEPGEQATVAFTSALAPGRYGLVCFVPAPDDVPHALKGMISEFTVGGGGTAGGGAGGGISPPNTGDGGLLQGTGFPDVGVYAVIAALVVLSSAGLYFDARRSS